MKRLQKTSVPYRWLAAVAVLFFMVRFPYRWFVNGTNLQDWGLAGVLPSFVCALALPMFGARWRSDRSAFLIFSFIPIIYELSQLHLIRAAVPWLIPTQRTFDIADILASLAGSFCALLVLRHFGAEHLWLSSPNKTMEPTR